MAPELYTKIEDYLDDALGEQERRAFEADARTDSALAETLNLVREARQRLVAQWADEPADTALLETLKQVGATHFKSGTGSGQSGAGGRMFRLAPTWWAAAAALAATVVAAWFFLRPPTNERLYAQYGAFPEADFTVRGDEPGFGDLSAAEATFNRKDYAEALRQLTAYLGNKPDDAQARLYAGLCHLELRQYDEAAAIFQQIGRSTNVWADEANWFLALAYLRQDKPADCRRILENIRPESGRYEQAASLLKEL